MLKERISKRRIHFDKVEVLTAKEHQIQMAAHRLHPQIRECAFQTKGVEQYPPNRRDRWTTGIRGIHHGECEWTYDAGGGGTAETESVGAELSPVGRESPFRGLKRKLENEREQEV